MICKWNTRALSLRAVPFASEPWVLGFRLRSSTITTARTHCWGARRGGFLVVGERRIISPPVLAKRYGVVPFARARLSLQHRLTF